MNSTTLKTKIMGNDKEVNVQFMTEKEIFETANALRKGYTQREMAEYLECSQPAVSKMLAGRSEMLTLAVKWIEMRTPFKFWELETDTNGKPVTYYKSLSSTR